MPPLICFTGIDGCGKSTQVSRLAAHLRELGLESETLWIGGNRRFTRPLVRFAKTRLRAPRLGPQRRYPPRDPDGKTVGEQFGEYLAASHSLAHRHRLLRRIWTDISLFEHALEIRSTVLPILRSDQLVICDRYIFRSVTNLMVMLDIPMSEIPRLLRHPAMRLIPKPSIYFLLEVSPEVAFSRKHDLPSIEHSRRRAPIYHELARHFGMTVIDATQPPDVVEAQVWEAVERVLAHHYALPKAPVATSSGDLPAPDEPTLMARHREPDLALGRLEAAPVSEAGDDGSLVRIEAPPELGR